MEPSSDSLTLWFCKYYTNMNKTASFLTHLFLSHTRYSLISHPPEMRGGAYNCVTFSILDIYFKDNKSFCLVTVNYLCLWQPGDIVTEKFICHFSLWNTSEEYQCLGVSCTETETLYKPSMVVWKFTLFLIPCKWIAPIHLSPFLCLWHSPIHLT